MDSGEIPIELGDSWFSPKIALGLASTQNTGGRALNGLGALSVTEPYQTPNAGYLIVGSQTTSDKIRGQEGNSPDHQLRSQNLD